MTTEGEDPAPQTPAKKTPKELSWKGLEVKVPGEIFYENGTEWIGVITGVSHKKSSAKRNAVYVTFKDDEKTYWFDKAKVIEWLTDRKIAEELRPTLMSRKNRRSLSESESSICPDVSLQSPDGADANGDASYISPLEKIPEIANRSMQKTPERPAKAEAGVHSHPAGEGTDAEDERKVLQTPSTSVVRRFSVWMVGKFRSDRPNKPDFEQEDDVNQPVHAETDEEMLDNDELDRLGGLPDNGSILTPSKGDNNGWLTKMTGAFYTPFSSRKIRKRSLAPMDKPRRRSSKDDELDVLSKKASKYRQAYEEGKMRFFEAYPDAHSTPENFRKHFASLGSEPLRTGSPDKEVNHGYEVDDEGGELDNVHQTSDQIRMVQWHPVHGIFIAAIVAAWASCVYFGSWVEESESVG